MKKIIHLLMLSCKKAASLIDKTSVYKSTIIDGISITEFEFDTAFKERKPIFAFNMYCEKNLRQ